jgi:hypothetical protein
MSAPTRQWGEREWEAYANGLLSIHYSLLRCSYQRIPATGGDCGLEGLSDTGEGYQSYADQGSKDNDDRVRKQKNKILTDIKKLEKYKTWWEAFLGPKKIRRWILMVPYMEDKQVVVYARRKAREMLKKSLSFIDSAFEGAVMTAEDFPAAKQVAREPVLPSAACPAPSAAQIATFKQTNPTFITHLEAKLSKVLGQANASSLDGLRDQLLQWHLQSSNLLGDMHTNFPAQWEDLAALISRKGDSIATESFIDLTSPRVRLSAVRRDFKEALAAEHRYLPEPDRETISWGTVSKWLGECPLNFPEGCNA